MEYRGKSYISVEFRREDFMELGLTMDSEDDKWDRAINIFDDRIRGRFLNQIENLTKYNDLIRDGFSIMALNCLLIETLLQFKNGWDQTPSGRNKIEYKKFLKEEFPEIFNNDKIAKLFYEDIRCGILHSAQTKNRSKLTFEQEYIVKLEEDNQVIVVDVIKITNAILIYYERYKNTIRDNMNFRLRENFLNKMMYICIRSN
ncbi:hypothetical protein [Romboutsia sp. MSSM.1001216sp_RTP31141st1_G3_RTP31141_220114]|uniref:hypothetical protein n=1 Tax=unclassified Romboutsia TaxID=2626894 RepID=UPI0031B5E510